MSGTGVSGRVPLLVVGEREDPFDVSGTATESIRELGRRGSFVAPAQESTLERSQPVRRFLAMAAGKPREDEHSLDVIAAALEAATDLTGDDARGGQPADSTLVGPEVAEVIHDCHRTPTSAPRRPHGRIIGASAAWRARSSSFHSPLQ